MLSDTVPFRMAGNLYFVGCKARSSHIIKTEEGLIMIDVGFESDVDAVVDSMAQLGFSPKEIRYILLSHGHDDHSGGAKRMRELSGAKVLVGEPDMKYLRPIGLTPDRFFRDGEVITLGSTSVTCRFTPGHSEGVFSFFFDLVEDGVVYRAGMFGGTSPNQLKKKWMNQYRVNYLYRGTFLRTLEMLRDEHVDIPIGNHTKQINQDEKYAALGKTERNPFIAPDEWNETLTKRKKTMESVISEETRTEFITYAHRGASEYNPENTMMSFYEGVRMGANGIETDVQITKDGVAVLFHDDTLLRVTGEAGSVSDYTLAELRQFTVKKGNLFDRIPTFEEFLDAFAWRDLTFAIELKQQNTERQVADLIYRYGIDKKCVVTSFTFDNLRRMREVAPELHTGWLKGDFDEENVRDMIALGIDEICPKAANVTPEKVAAWHALGLNVRAWGVSNPELMKAVYDAHADGMTVNFPDLLVALREGENPLS